MGHVLRSTIDIGLKPDISGKVRDIFDLEENLLIVATDRISAYDVILAEPVPLKGIILTQMTLGWYEYFGEEVETHFITAEVASYPEPFRKRPELEGRSMLVRKAQRLDVECVVRGYLAGSGWREYREKGTVCGIKLPDGLDESDRLPEPIFTPATKAQSGHDENITFQRMREIVPERYAAVLRDLSIDIYTRAHEYALDKGIIVADTKFEFGLSGDRVILIDEMLSPDSSRFWPADDYRPGRGQRSFDKQYVRDYLDRSGWDHSPPPPHLPEDVLEKTSSRYMEACRKLFPHIDLERYL